MKSDRSNSSDGHCTALIGSMTLSMKARTALAREAIPSSTVKVNSSSTRHGCAYGVSFDCAQAQNVQIILDRVGIPIKELL